MAVLAYDLTGVWAEESCSSTHPCQQFDGLARRPGVSLENMSVTCAPHLGDSQRDPTDNRCHLSLMKS